VAARSGPRNTRLLVVGLVVASLAIITVDYREGDSGPLADVGRAARTFMAPLQEAVTNATRPVGNFFSGVAHLPSLAQENTDLKRELADAQARINATSQIEAQNQELLNLLNLKQSLRPTSVPAVVTSNGMSNINYYVTIDRGSNDGVRVNDPVVTGDINGARLVGIVVFVTDISADVRLLIDDGFSVPGRLATSDQRGLVVGNGDQDLTMQDIPSSTKFPPGDAAAESVFTISYSIGDQHGRFPPNILIGTVSSVQQGGVQPDAEVSVRPAVDFSSLETVLVLQTADGGSG
jgi:rod shape-determining protein MreC